MTRYNKELVSCPFCSQENNVMIYESVNMQLDLTLWGKIKDGSLFQFSCRKCGKIIKLSYPFWFHDMESQLIVYYTPETDDEKLDDILEGLNKMIGGMSHLQHEFGISERYRFVNDFKDLMEKEFIFSDGLDDRIVEIMKRVVETQVLDEMRKSQPNIEVLGSSQELYWINSKTGKRQIVFLFEENEDVVVEFDSKLYEIIKDEFSDKISFEEGKVLEIDYIWSVDTMNYLEKEHKI